MSGKSTGKRRGRPTKKGKLCLKWRQQLERELRKKQKEEEEAAEAVVAAAATGGGADAGSAAATAAATRAAKGAAVAAAEGAAVAAAETAAAAEAVAAASAPSERHAAYCRLGKEAQINGTVKRVKPSWRDEEAHREAEQRLTVEQVALRKMREQRHGWVCALWVQEQLHVFLARDLEGVAGGRKEGWIEKVVAGGGKESEPVRVTKEQLESQHMVVMDKQEFFFFDIDRVDLFSDVMGYKKGQPVVGGRTVGYKEGQQVLHVGGDERRNATVVSVDGGRARADDGGKRLDGRRCAPRARGRGRVARRVAQQGLAAEAEGGAGGAGGGAGGAGGGPGGAEADIRAGCC